MCRTVNDTKGRNFHRVKNVRIDAQRSYIQCCPCWQRKFQLYWEDAHPWPVLSRKASEGQRRPAERSWGRASGRASAGPQSASSVRASLPSTDGAARVHMHLLPLVSAGQMSAHSLAGFSASGSHRVAIQMLLGASVSSEARLRERLLPSCLRLLAEFISLPLPDCKFQFLVGV